MLTIKQALVWAKQQLTKKNSIDDVVSTGGQNIDFETHLLLAHVLDVKPTWLRTWPDHILNAKQQHYFEELCLRRAAGEPIAYLIGEWSFWSFQLAVTKETLIPRPETEHLVDWVLRHFPVDKPLTVADLGTGSGAIALALALERPHWRIIATDRSVAALNVAKANAERLKIQNIEWYEGNWFAALPMAVCCDVIVSNPPYIAPNDPHLLFDGLSFEPQTALVAADEGFTDLEHLIQHAKKYLQPHGWLALEHGYNQSERVQQAFKNYGFAGIQTIKDYAGCDRITFAQIELYL